VVGVCHLIGLGLYVPNLRFSGYCGLLQRVETRCYNMLRGYASGININAIKLNTIYIINAITPKEP